MGKASLDVERAKEALDEFLIENAKLVLLREVLPKEP